SLLCRVAREVSRGRVTHAPRRSHGRQRARPLSPLPISRRTVTHLRRLRERMAEGQELTLSRDEALEVLAELETSRRVIEQPVESLYTTLLMHREMLAQLLVCLAADVSTPQEARLVAGVVVQELAGLIRLQVKSERI